MAKLALVRHGQSQWNLENRFTGWVDSPLTDLGRQEARRAGERLKGIHFDRTYTSALVRAQETLAIMLEVLGQTDLAPVKDKALNERHYGALQGLNKKETADKYGEQQVHIWRRSYDVAPPKDKTELNPEGVSESLKDTAARTLPFFYGHILPDLKLGNNVLVSAHGNSLRSIVMDLDQLSKDEVLELNIATGVPLLYEIDAGGAVQEKQILD